MQSQQQYRLLPEREFFSQRSVSVSFASGTDDVELAARVKGERGAVNRVEKHRGSEQHVQLYSCLALS